jgi:hypothetical protein
VKDQRPPKTEIVAMRVTVEQKASIRAAADQALMPISEFVLNAVLAAIREPADASPRPNDAKALAPTLCWLVDRARSGGETGYRWAARLLCRVYPDLARGGSEGMEDFGWTDGGASMVAEPTTRYGPSEPDREAIGREFKDLIEAVLSRVDGRRSSNAGAPWVKVPNRRMKALGLGALDGRFAGQADVREADGSRKTPRRKTTRPASTSKARQRKKRGE